MDGFLLSLIEAVAKASPFVGLLLYLWLSERQERRTAQDRHIAEAKAWGEERAQLLERALTVLNANTAVGQATEQTMRQVTALLARKR